MGKIYKVPYQKFQEMIFPIIGIERTRIQKPKIMDYTRYIMPVGSYSEERKIIRRMYCPVCKTKNSCKLLERNKKVENQYVYDIAIISCSHCNSRIRLRFFVYTDTYNKKNPTYKKYKSLLEDC